MATPTPKLTDPQAEKLRHIQSIPALVKYLDEELGWPVGMDDWEDAVYNWQPQELNLKTEHQVAIKSIMQLKPLVSGQPWGIFFVDFDKGQLPIVVLRRVLNGLIVKRRVKGSGHQTWLARDLLFVSSFGEDGAREIALAHFTDESDVGDLPTLRVLGWDAADTALELGYVARTLKDKLRWPAATASKLDQDAWRTQWAGAFSLKYRQVINDSKSLALALAALAKGIRTRVNAVLALESDKGHLRQLHKAFKDNLIADLSEDGFADMFAQTITYGLFTARASRTSGALVADDISQMVPSTNPFLKELLADFLSAAGRDRQKKKRVDFDELGINEVVTVLRDVPMDAVLRSFNASKPGDDPVIHFYEDFLKAYDKAMRAKRGVFYTPSPVVQFIVRSVDEILKTEFGIEDGLASTITWGEMLARKPELKLPKFCTPVTPFIQILDPATGTGTFIVEVITHVHAHMMAKWRMQGKVTKAQWQPLWVDYVKHHLLPRLYAFELMMAPYAIAHMKIGLKLAETGYTFPEDGPRVNVFLTNALEPAHPVQAHLESMAPMLAHEANAANLTKEQCCFTVIVGNPPYAGHSANNNVPGIVAAVHEYKRGYPDLQKPGQGKWLQNDYVKFMRLSELRILNVGVGILGFITDHSYLDNPTFKGMRRHLRQSFPYLRIVDLHGNSKKKEKALDGSKDESVFGIIQGTAIGLYAHGAATASEKSLDVLGTETFKAEAMLRISLQTETLTTVVPNEPLWLFKPQAQAGRNDYENGWGLPVIFSPNGDPAPGIVTTHDEFAISWNATEARAKVKALLATGDETEAREIFQLCTQEQWNYSDAKEALADGAWKKKIVPVLYRPFDIRTTIYDNHVAVHRRDRVMGQLLGGDNLAVTVGKAGQVIDNNPWTIVAATRQITDFNFYRRGGNCPFPLWLFKDEGKVANLSPSFLNTFQSALNLTPADYRPKDSTAPLHAEKIFHYIYAVLHSPTYRQRYAAFLRTDFPRIELAPVVHTP
jgi:predicted helicase